MTKSVLVTGANGHLGNNLVRELIAAGDRVVAGVRDPARATSLAGLDCRIARMDLLDRGSLVEALSGVDVLYQVAAVFSHWAADPEREIYQANMDGTRNVLEAAASAGVSRVVYVSSLAALDRSAERIDETTWNPDRTNVYYRSKTDSERLAWELADRLALDMVSVLPGAMVGRNCERATPTMALLETILAGKLPVDPGFHFNFVDVEEVAAACRRAAEAGRPGERYLLANADCTSVREAVEIARREYPERRIRPPARPPRPVLYAIAALMEAMARVRGTEPALQRNFLTAFTVRERCDASKARRELGFDPRPPHATIASAFRWIAEPRSGRQATNHRADPLAADPAPL